MKNITGTSSIITSFQNHFLNWTGAVKQFLLYPYSP